MILSFVLSGEAYANAIAYGGSKIQINLSSNVCLAQRSESLDKAILESAQADATINCNSEFPGSKARGIQRIIENSTNCANTSSLEVNFAAVYFCG